MTPPPLWVVDTHPLTFSSGFISFDLFFAVFAQLVVLFVAYLNFSFDRAYFDKQIEMVGGFEATARIYVDPAQVSVFRLAFQNVQLTTPLGLNIKVFLNFFSLSKWRRIVIYLINTSHERRLHVTHVVTKPSKIKKRHFVAMSALFLGATLGILTYTVVAIQSSRAICAIHTHCAVISYQWNAGYHDCTCLVYIDRDPAPKTYAEWVDPVDTTDELALVAAAGDLKIIQIMNRKLEKLPEKMRRNRQLELL